MGNNNVKSGEWAAYGAEVLTRILAAALQEFAERGYHATSIRDIASRAGLSVPGLYHHYRAKQDILVDLMMVTMDELQARTEAALDSADGRPDGAFDAVVENLLRFHMARQQQALVSSTEIRSLEAEHRSVYVSRRDAQQQVLEAAIRTGVAAGAFRTEHPKDAARAVASMCVAVSSWYRADGALSVSELAARYLGLARALVQAVQ